MSRLPKDTWGIDLSPLTKLHVCVETQKEKEKEKKGVCECKMDGRVRKKQREAAWKNLMNADSVSWWSPPTRVWRKDSCFSPDSHRLVNRIVLLQLQPCWQWIWTWQQTRGTLLAALSFNNRYPSPSVSSVSWVCSCLFWPFFLLSVSLSPFFFLSYALSISCNVFPTSAPGFQELFYPCDASFHLPLQPAFHTLIQSLPFPLSLPLFSSLYCYIYWYKLQQKIL